LKLKLHYFLYHYSNKTTVITFWLLFCCFISNAQSLDFDSFRGNPFKIGGSIAANSTFFQSNRNARDPFVYNFIGNINVSFYSFSMPISYNFTNLGGKLDYQIPFNFNRLSVSPKYKWITAHIGDVSMTFSPYSLAGHQFTGAGIELSPNSPIKFSAMYGRFLKAVEDDGNPNSIPSFERWGYGSKIDFVKSKYKIGLVGFYAKDIASSLSKIPVTKEITPKENLVVGVTLEGQINPDLKLYADYSNSSVIQNTLAEGTGQKNGLSTLFIKGNSSLQNFNALKIGFDFKVNKTTLGASFERVDPNYQTLGAYFFANDLQNIMINTSRPFYHDKVNMTLNLGVQKDNLDNRKAQTTGRLIGSLNLNAKFSDNLTSTLSITNQTTTTNVNPDQFLQINQVNPELNNVSQINYRQLSQSVTISTNYNIKATKTSKRNLMFNYAFNQVANEQGGIIRLGQLSTFHNISTAYSHQFLKSKWALNSSANVTYSTIGIQNTTTFGPVIGINKKFLKDKLTTQFSSAFNASISDVSSTKNFNFRITSSYKLFDSHNFNFMASQIFSNSSTTSSVPKPSLNELTVTFGYNYNFAGFKKKEAEKKTVASLEKEKIDVNLNKQKIEADSYTIKNTVTKIIDTLKTTNVPTFETKIRSKKDSVLVLLAKFDAEKDEKIKAKIETDLKSNLQGFDTEIKTYTNFLNSYTFLTTEAFKKLKIDTKEKAVFSKRYFINKYKLEIDSKGDTSFEDITAIENKILSSNLKIAPKDLFALAQFRLLNELQENENAITELIQKLEIENQEKDNFYKKFLLEKKLDKYIDALEVKLMDIYIKQYLVKFKNNIKTK
jgi:hypothetical protein